MGYSYMDPSNQVCEMPPEPEPLMCSMPEGHGNAAAAASLESHGGHGGGEHASSHHGGHGAHGGGHEDGHHDPLHPVHQVVNGIETAHTVAEGYEAAHTGASLAHHGHEMAELYQGEQAMTGAQMTSSTVGAVLAPVSIGLGGYEAYEGFESGDAYQVMHGTSGVVGGGATLTSMVAGGMGETALAAGAAEVAPLAASLGVGLWAGHEADGAANSYARDNGTWGLNEDGSGRTVSEVGFEIGQRADHAVADWTGNETAGLVAGATTAGLMEIGGVVDTGIAAAGHGIASAAEAVWDWL